jgi:hypothetical protein
MPSRTSLVSVGGSFSPPFPNTYLGEGVILPHVMDTQKGSFNPSKPSTSSSRTYSVPVGGPSGPPWLNTCLFEGDTLPLAIAAQKGSYSPSKPSTSYCEVRNASQSISTLLEHLGTLRKPNATRRDNVTLSHITNTSHLGVTTLESQSLSLQDVKTKYRILRSKSSQLFSSITCEWQQESLKSEAQLSANAIHASAGSKDSIWKLIYYSLLVSMTEEYLMKENAILLDSVHKLSKLLDVEESIPQ